MKNKLRRLNSVKVWVKNVMDWEVANENIVKTFEEQYVQQSTEFDRNAEPVNILVLDGGGMKGYGGLKMLLSIQELYCKEKGRDLFQQFDFFAGTSIGGVSALGAADLNSQGISIDTIIRENGVDLIDAAREKCFKSISFKNLLTSKQLVRKGSQVIDILQQDFDKPMRQDQSIPTMVCIAAVKERHVFHEMEETLEDISTRELEPFIARTYEYPLVSEKYDQPKPLACSSSDMKLYEAMAATSAVPLVLDSVKVDVEGKKRIMGDGGIFQNCPMALALDEIRRLYPTRPLGVILNIGYGPEEETLIHRTIETARLVHPNLHYQRIAPHQIFKDFSAAETDRKVITDMEAQVEQYIKNTPQVKNVLKVTMKKLLESKPRCFGKRCNQKSAEIKHSWKQNNILDLEEQLRRSLLRTFGNSYFGDDLSLADSSVSSSSVHDELISLESYTDGEKQKEAPIAHYDLSKEVIYDSSKEVTFEVKNKRKRNFLQKFKLCQSL